MRRAARKDGNQEHIAEVFKEFGFSTADTSALGNGFPDLVVGGNGVNVLIEVKDSAQPPSKRRLTDKERAFYDGWKGPIFVIESEEEADACARRLLEIMGATLHN
jgi:hypothetical protein